MLTQAPDFCIICIRDLHGRLALCRDQTLQARRPDRDDKDKGAALPPALVSRGGFHAKRVDQHQRTRATLISIRQIWIFSGAAQPSGVQQPRSARNPSERSRISFELTEMKPGRH